MTWDIPLFKIYWDEADVDAVNDVLRSGMFWAEGPQIADFETQIADYIGTDYSLVFSNGTTGLHALLTSYGIGPGDEVIVPSFTFISTANSVLLVGAEPVFADIEKQTYGLSPEDVKLKITSKTKAIIAVHYAGCPCHIETLRDVADEAGILLIEDAAEAFGASVNEKKIGTFGDSAMFSFCQNKIITTGEGGAICTNSGELYEKMKLYRSHGREMGIQYFESAGKEDYVDLGHNFRMPTMLAALGISQLSKVDTIIEKRRQLADYYMKELTLRSKLFDFPVIPNQYNHVYQMFYGIVNCDRDGLIGYLQDHRIMTKVYFDPIHLSSFYRNKRKVVVDLPVTEEVSKEIITLPMFPHLSTDEIDIIVNAVMEYKR